MLPQWYDRSTFILMYAERSGLDQHSLHHTCTQTERTPYLASSSVRALAAASWSELYPSTNPLYPDLQQNVFPSQVAMHLCRCSC